MTATLLPGPLHTPVSFITTMDIKTESATLAIYDIYDGDGFGDKHYHGDNGDGGGHRTELQFEIFKCPLVKPLPGTGH